MSDVSGLLSISVVSHGQIELVRRLLADLGKYCQATTFEVILTLNIEEAFPLGSDVYPFPLHVIRNDTPKGFGANHNAAFRQAKGKFFCVANPDIRLIEDPFPPLIGRLAGKAGVVAPLVANPEGGIEDSARRFPTPWRIVRKVFGGAKGPDYAIGKDDLHPDWVGGMFMLFTHEVFGTLGGFDERYFLYYEDVDLCARLTLDDLAVVLCPQVRVIHEARRSSHRNMRFMKWHLTSMARFFLSKPFRGMMMRAMFRSNRSV